MHDAENNAEPVASTLAMYRLREPWQWSALIRRPLDIAWHAAEGWVDHRCDSQAAAVAFYALFSLAPMLVLVVAIGGYMLDASVASERIFVELRTVVGVSAAEAVRATFAQAKLSDWSSQATIASTIVTLVGATASFAELKGALNGILGYQQEP